MTSVLAGKRAKQDEIQATVRSFRGLGLLGVLSPTTRGIVRRSLQWVLNRVARKSPGAVLLL